MSGRWEAGATGQFSFLNPNEGHLYVSANAEGEANEEKQRNQQSYFLIWRASLGGEGHLPVGKGMLSVRKGRVGG